MKQSRRNYTRALKFEVFAGRGDGFESMLIIDADSQPATRSRFPNGWSGYWITAPNPFARRVQ